MSAVNVSPGYCALSSSNAALMLSDTFAVA